ncbi:MAG: hypothetical protein CFK52_00260 [Chloracidobacterium sp. CP2_5A]|nr:MAG: hypothetical protein CFK52_00260 [Chloracidobacterium sp. CP2_5A]
MIDTKSVRQSLLQDRAVLDAIRRRAHQLSLERGYSTPQHMADDWFRAESEVLEKLLEEEVKRRQKMNAAISEGAMAEEAVPAVTLPPALAHRLAELPAAAKKPVAQRKKATAPSANEPANQDGAPAIQPIAPASPPADAVAATTSESASSEPASAAASKPKRTRKPSAPKAAPATPASKSKAAKPAKKKLS